MEENFDTSRGKKKSEVLVMLELFFNKRNELSSPIQANSTHDTLFYSVTNSRQISHGTRSEAAIDNIVSSRLGFEVLDNTVWYAKKGEEKPKKRKADHIWRVKEGVIYVVEQKLKDNHDNTKKDGQTDDFNAKVKAVREEHPDERVIGVFWFVEDSEKPSEHTLKVKLEEDCVVRYGAGIFSEVEYGQETFGDVLKWFDDNRHDDLNIRFDKDPEYYFDNLVLYIDDKEKKFLKKFMNDKIVCEYILPVISSEGKFAGMVKNFLEQ